MKMCARTQEKRWNIRCCFVEKSNWNTELNKEILWVKLFTLFFNYKLKLIHHVRQFSLWKAIEKDANAQGIEDSQCNQDFESNLLKFERQKISDIRQILMDFTLIQLKETVASMDILSSMYNEIAAIDADRDVVVRKFQKNLNNICFFSKRISFFRNLSRNF